MIIPSRETEQEPAQNGAVHSGPEESGTRVSEALTAEFAKLAAEWKEQGKYLSSPTAIANLPAYRAIVAMGNNALPYILRDLQDEPDLWFTALKRITGTSPVPESARGNIQRMAEAWLQWGREHGIIA